jgi:hypothetical protein
MTTAIIGAAGVGLPYRQNQAESQSATASGVGRADAAGTAPCGVSR